MTKYERQSIGKDAATELYNSKWYEGKSHRELAMWQMFTLELSMPFSILHEAVEKTLGRPVFTHEFGLNYDGICDELLGKSPPPSLDEILDLIPKEKRLIVCSTSNDNS